MTAAGLGWRVVRRTAPAGELHAPWPGADLEGERVLALCRVEGRAALVLGSTQAVDVADAAALDDAGVELVHRRSGGGAVLVEPGRQVWVDAWIPRADPLWEDDVVRSAWWLGDAWSAALTSLGARAPVSVHHGPAVATRWSRTVCFAGLGPGEVSVGGRKVVGLAQRRTRAGARVHAMALVHWDPAALLRLLALGPDERRAAEAETATGAEGLAELVAGGAPDGSIIELVEAAVLAQLPDGKGAEQHGEHQRRDDDEAPVVLEGEPDDAHGDA